MAISERLGRPKEVLDHSSFLITIDGSTTAGKRVLGEKLAEQYNLTLLNTGSTIRALALLAIEQNLVKTDDMNIVGLPADFAERIVYFYDNLPEKFRIEKPIEGSHTARIMLGKREMRGELLTYPKQKAIENLSSVIAATPLIRERMYELWRDAVSRFDGAVVIGRRTGVDLFPKAPVKLYLFASPEASAQYRVVHDPQADKDYSNETLYIRERDGRDREMGLLERSPDALIIDTSSYITDREGFSKLNNRVAAHISERYDLR